MRSGEDEENSVKVKHAISFRNPTGQPLTGGPVSILARQNEEVESKFMVQAMMKFTGPEKPIIVEITRAMDVQVKVEMSHIHNYFLLPPGNLLC